jgi:succinylglutamate desuccinylase
LKSKIKRKENRKEKAKKKEKKGKKLHWAKSGTGPSCNVIRAADLTFALTCGVHGSATVAREL